MCIHVYHLHSVSGSQKRSSDPRTRVTDRWALGIKLRSIHYNKNRKYSYLLSQLPSPRWAFKHLPLRNHFKGAAQIRVDALSPFICLLWSPGQRLDLCTFAFLICKMGTMAFYCLFCWGCYWYGGDSGGDGGGSGMCVHVCVWVHACVCVRVGQTLILSHAPPGLSTLHDKHFTDSYIPGLRTGFVLEKNFNIFLNLQKKSLGVVTHACNLSM